MNGHHHASRAVIVTGAAGGIGFSTAQIFAERGDQVLMVDLDGDAAEAAARAIDPVGDRVRSCAADVSSESDARRISSDCHEVFGGVDVVVNNAGVARRGGVETVSGADWDLVHNINVKGILLVSRYAVPLMRERGGGAIVNLASVHSYASTPGLTAYAASKGAVLAMTRQMAVELGADGIRVNAVAPSYIVTPMTSGFTAKGDDEPEYAKRVAASPLRRWGRADEVAATIWFLASSDASFVSGSCLAVDGGALGQLLPE